VGQPGASAHASLRPSIAFGVAYSDRAAAVDGARSVAPAPIRAGAARPTSRPRTTVTLPPWEYFFEPFTRQLFPDLFDPIWISSLVLLVVLIVLYNVRTRRLHRHAPYLDLWEWLLWTGLITFSLLVVEAIFRFDFILVVTTIVAGVGTLLWVRFRRFPPILAGYERGLARQRYFSRTKFTKPETTIRPKPARRRRRR
jgi:small-conductance mechanosensitive channel